MNESNYTKYRGKCKEFVDAAMKEDPTLTAIRGWYDCPFEGKRTHWWCKTQNGEIYDPTKLQFQSAGVGEYIEYDGILYCSQCSKEMKEEEAFINGNYAFCSFKCHGKFVGIF